MANLGKTMEALSPLAILQNPEGLKSNPLSPVGMLWGALDKDKRDKAEVARTTEDMKPKPPKPVGYY